MSSSRKYDCKHIFRILVPDSCEFRAPLQCGVASAISLVLAKDSRDSTMMWRTSQSWNAHKVFFSKQACLWGSNIPERISVRVAREGGYPSCRTGSPKDLGTNILVLRSWYQNLGTKILVPRCWYQDFGTKILVPKKTESPRGGASRYAGGRGGLPAPRQGLWGSGSLRTIFWWANGPYSAGVGPCCYPPGVGE